MNDKYKIIWNENPVVNLITGRQDLGQARYELAREDGEVMLVSKHKEMLSEYVKESRLEVRSVN